MAKVNFRNLKERPEGVDGWARSKVRYSLINYSTDKSDQQNHLMAQHGDGPEDFSLTLIDWCNYATNVPT